MPKEAGAMLGLKVMVQTKNYGIHTCKIKDMPSRASTKGLHIFRVPHGMPPSLFRWLEVE